MMWFRHTLAAFLVYAFAAHPAAAQQRVVPESNEQIQLSYAALVKEVAPAVVNIFTTKSVRRRTVTSLFDDPFFRNFFGDGFGFGGGGGLGPEEKVQNSLGSGVILTADGLIVTNNHVIAGADDIKVVLADRREFAAELVGKDEKTDLAVLRVDPGQAKLPFLELADSNRVEVGDLVLAIGNPFGVGQTVTSGIVSALARTGVAGSDLDFFIQTDAAINPGNSGGALVSINGSVVGINTAIFTKSGGSHGIGFAIPSNLVRAVINGVVRDGRLVRPWMGIKDQKVTADIGQSLGMARPQGILVRQVYPGAAGDNAGLQVGDVILAANGHEVNDPNGLKFRVTTAGLGADVPLRVLRDGDVLALSLRVEAPPLTRPEDPTELRGRHPFSGTTVVNLSPAIADRVGLDPFLTGVMVAQVRQGSEAAERGFKRFDIVRQLNGTQIQAIDDLTDELDRASGQWQVQIERKGRKLDGVFQAGQ